MLVVETTGTISDMHCSTTLFLCVWGERERDGEAADEIVCVFDNTILCTAIAILRLFWVFFLVRGSEDGLAIYHELT